MARKSSFFVIPGEIDQAKYSEVLKGLTPKFETPDAARPFEFLDCHDQSLRASGQVLIETDNALLMVQDAGEVLDQACRGKGKFVKELPDGPVRAALKGFPKLRALMSMGGGTIETSSFAVTDDLHKAQVRGDLLSLASRNGRVTILSVHPMRGNHRAFQAVCSALSEVAAGADGIELMFRKLLPGVVPYKAKPEIRLGKNEPSIEVATDIIRTYLAVARQNEAGVIADIDTEFLHDYRVSLRRIRSVLSLFKGVFSPEQTIALKQEFAGLMEPTGQLRDLDVYLLEKDIYFNLIPPDLHAGVTAMFTQFRADRASALATLSQRLQSTQYEQQMKDLSALFSDVENLRPGPGAERGAYSYACTLIWKRYRKVCKLARRITPKTPDRDVHKLRIDCKKLRYLMEFFAPLFDKKAFKTLIKPLKRLQDNLGLFNDYSVQQNALLNFVSGQRDARGRTNTQLAMAVGGLIAVLSQRQRAERDRVIANFQHFDSPDIQHLFRKLFHHKKD